MQISATGWTHRPLRRSQSRDTSQDPSPCRTTRANLRQGPRWLVTAPPWPAIAVLLTAAGLVPTDGHTQVTLTAGADDFRFAAAAAA